MEGSGLWFYPASGDGRRFEMWGDRIRCSEHLGVGVEQADDPRIIHAHDEAKTITWGRRGLRKEEKGI